MFKPTQILDFHSLPIHTKYRLIEIEINQGINTLVPFAKSKTIAIGMMIDALGISTTTAPLFSRAFSSRRFTDPTKHELIHYFLYKGIGIAAVTNYAKTSPNKALALRNVYPDYVPVFQEWENYRHILLNWNQIKSSLNLFDNNLIHLKNNFQIL